MRGESPKAFPAHFNMAHYCLALSGDSPRHRDATAMIVVHDTQAPPEAAEHWTYGQLDDAVRRVAAGLLSQGFAPGDRIMIRMGNTSDYALMFFGCLAAGLIALPSSPQLTREEALFLLEDSGARALAATEDLILDGVPGTVSLLTEPDFTRLKSSPPLRDYAPTKAEDPAFLIYTSGTSGVPKGVVHAHRSAWGRRPMYQGWYGYRPGDRILHAGAFNWTYTLGAGLTDPWANGLTAILYNGPKDPAVWPTLIARYGATIFAAVPALYRQILKYGTISPETLATLRHGLTAGEALSPALLDTWRAATGKPLYEALGMSECSTYISSSPSVPVKPGSPGKPQAGRRVAILPQHGGDAPLPPGQTGLLAVHRSDPGLMLGYLNRPEEEAAVWRGEWFCGGDLAAMDEDGYVWFHGRADDVMTAMGYRVSPQEVEAVMARHPDVAEVAVAELQVRDDVAVIAAFVVPRPGAAPDREALLAHARRHLAAYKAPREVVFVGNLPRSANGKVIRRLLRQFPP